MIEKTIYIAEDGTEFDDDFDCKKYELELQGKGLNIICLDRDKDPIKLGDTGDVFYVNLPTQRCVEYFNKIAEYYGYPTIETIGEWFYDESQEEWSSIYAEIEYLQYKINELKSLFN